MAYDNVMESGITAIDPQSVYNAKAKKVRQYPMNIGMMIICVIGGLTGILSAAYLLISMPVVIVWKFYRKIRFGYKMYQ